MLTLEAGFTGGSAWTAGDYYVTGVPLLMPAGQTTCQLSAILNGPPISGGTAVTASTLSSGRLTLAADGVLDGGHGPSPRSARGR